MNRRIWFIIFNKFVKSRRKPEFVIPVETGIQETQILLAPPFRGGDAFGEFLRIRQFSPIKSIFYSL